MTEFLNIMITVVHAFTKRLDIGASYEDGYDVITKNTKEWVNHHLEGYWVIEEDGYFSVFTSSPAEHFANGGEIWQLTDCKTNVKV